MYGMVLMVAITGSGDSASFGKRGGMRWRGLHRRCGIGWLQRLQR
ncbi:MAG: hypothetical protein U0792_17385 [Gemmataceae bacterium]